MSFAVGIAGLPNVGKSTLLNALTHAGAEASNYPFCTIDRNVGMAPVPDPDLERLRAVLEPRETVPATVRVVDVAGLVPGASKGEGLGNAFLGHLREVDALLHVVRCFEDPNVPHAPGPADPARDVGLVETEFLLADLEVASRAREKLAKAHQLPPALERAERELAAGRLLRDLAWSPEERAVLLAYRFLTAKPCLYVANTGETDPEGRGPLADVLRAARGAEHVLAVSVRVEEEISELPPTEQAEYLAAMGLHDTALGLVVAGCLRLLDLITFYTIANEKLRAWHLPRGGTAPQAAGRVHTDMETGFIRAEVMGLDALLALGSRAALHARGLIHAAGRDYIVKDKDVLQFHFKV
jgi:GTP-binding protein YchF